MASSPLPGGGGLASRCRDLVMGWGAVAPRQENVSFLPSDLPGLTSLLDGDRSPGAWPFPASRSLLLGSRVPMRP